MFRILLRRYSISVRAGCAAVFRVIVKPSEYDKSLKLHTPYQRNGAIASALKQVGEIC